MGCMYPPPKTHETLHSPSNLAEFRRFRWTDCQLNLLRKCLTMAGLRKALRSLPKSLDNTYSRILINIDEEYRRETYTVLQWLTFSVRPLHLVEVAEAVAVRPGSDFLDGEEKLRDPHVILSICSSLVVLSEFGELRLAHYSVKEYLVSERIRTSPASPFVMMVDSGNKKIAEICLTYLSISDQWNLSSHSRFLDFPLLRYAIQNWHVTCSKCFSRACADPRDTACCAIPHFQG